MYGTYKIVAEFSDIKHGRAWLCQHTFNANGEFFVRYEMHVVLGATKAVILDECEFRFLIDVLSKAKDLADKKAEKVYAKDAVLSSTLA